MTPHDADEFRHDNASDEHDADEVGGDEPTEAPSDDDAPRPHTNHADDPDADHADESTGDFADEAHTDDDLDLHGTMSFGDHLEELRRRVIVSALTVVVIFVALFFVRNTIMAIVIRPVRMALVKKGVIQPPPTDTNGVKDRDATGNTDATDANGQGRRVSFYVFGVPIVEWSVVDDSGDPPSGGARPPDDAQADDDAAGDDDSADEAPRAIPPGDASVYTKSPIEGVITLVKILGIAAIFLSAPIVGYQVWAFVAAGLYPRERRLVYYFAPMTIGLFMAGMVFCYFVMLRVALPYLIGFVMDFARPMFFVNETAMFIIHICLVMGLVFQIPVIILFLVKSRLVSVAQITHYRRHCYLITVTLGAILTPPEVFTQLLMAGPMILLFELGVLLGRWSERGRRKGAA